MTRRILPLGFLALLLIAPVDLLACNGSTVVTTCTATCSSNCYLANDVNCSNGQGITLTNGADLDMCGRTIECTAEYCLAQPAVTMTANNSRVYSSVSPDTAVARIKGLWFEHVDCGLKSGSRVDGIKIEGVSFYGAYDCATVENSYFDGPDYPIFTHGVANSDSINDNHIIVATKGIVAATGIDISIHHNLLELKDDASIAIDLHFASAPLTAVGNVVMGATADGQIINLPSPSGFDVSDNICESGITDCATCRSAGFCLKAQPGFVFP